MTIENETAANEDTNLESGHSLSRHRKMMALCLGIPVLSLFTISALNISIPSLEVLLLLVCPLFMGAMMWLMGRQHHSGDEFSHHQGIPSKAVTVSSVIATDTALNNPDESGSAHRH